MEDVKNNAECPEEEFSEEVDYSGDDYYDDANIAYELVNQFVETLSGKETQAELKTLIDDKVEEIKGWAATFDVDYIRELISDAINAKFSS